MTLFGFADREELEFFRLLITVQGVGPKAAMSLLSLYDPQSLAALIADEDTRSIAKASGVGGKIAARIVLELKDKFAKAFPVPTSDVALPSSKQTAAAPRGSATKLSDARDALTVLGFTRSEATDALRNVNTDQPLEDVIKDALAALMK